jgi:WD40 repeat protein
VLRVWDAETGRQKLAARTDEGPLLGVAVSGDGLRLVSGSSDGTVRVWDAETVQEKLLLKRAPATCPARSIAFSDDGTRILVAGDGAVHVWEAERASGEGPRQ